MKVFVKHLDTRHFVGRNEAGLETHFDTPPEEGGSGSAPGPMQSVAMALGACSGIDVVSILNKSRQSIDSFEIEIDYEREKDKTPSVFTKIHLHYILTGNIDPKKVLRAVSLSVGKYCSVTRMLEKTAAITYSYSVNGTRYE